jgi:enamine deaminase RidA (YjgF/YER057c/UK114 family)
MITGRTCGLRGTVSGPRVLIHYVNFGDYAAMNAEYASHFAPGRLPARTTVGVTGLALGGAVEVMAPPELR